MSDTFFAEKEDGRLHSFPSEGLKSVTFNNKRLLALTVQGAHELRPRRARYLLLGDAKIGIFSVTWAL